MLEVRLTNRQIQIVRNISEDLNTKEIAAKLGVTEKTVEFHIQAIKRKIGVAGIAGIVRMRSRTA